MSKIKKFIPKLIFAIIWLGLLVSSFMIFDQIGGRGYTILIVAPRYGTMQAEVVEQHNTDIRLTYAAPQSAAITTLGHYHHTTIIGTNHEFANVMRYLWVNGDFFTDKALKYTHNVAVLNITAAVDIFGERRANGNTFYFEGKLFQVIGVIDDRDDSNANIYVPITSILNYSGIDAVAFDAGILYFFNQPEIFALLQTLNITKENYHIINLFAAHQVINNYHTLVVTLFILVIFEAITSKAIKTGLRNWRKIARLNETDTGLWRILFSKSCLALLASAAVVVAIFVTIGLESTDVFLSIGEIINAQNPFAAIPETVFTRHVQELVQWYFWIIVVFWVSLVTFVLYFIIIFGVPLQPKKSHNKKLNLERKIMNNTFTETIFETELTFETRKTSFSPLGIDKGTLAMLSVANLAENLTSEDKLLDLGCGYGVVGIYTAKLVGEQNIVMSDNSKSCVELSKRNAELNGVDSVKVILSDGFSNITDTDFLFILSNPPYHADFSVPKHFIEKGFNRLKVGGKMYMVTKRKEWYKNKLTAIFGGVKVYEVDEYYVFCAEKRTAQYANKVKKR